VCMSMSWRPRVAVLITLPCPNPDPSANPPFSPVLALTMIKPQH